MHQLADQENKLIWPWNWKVKDAMESSLSRLQKETKSPISNLHLLTQIDAYSGVIRTWTDKQTADGQSCTHKISTNLSCKLETNGWNM